MKYFARLILFVAMALTLSQSACADNLLPTTELAGWSADSEALASLVQFVSESVDESHEGYTPPEDRIAVFDFDGTLYGELFPTSFNLWFNGWRALHCGDYDAPERLKVYAAQKEAELLYGTEFRILDTDAQMLFNGSGLFEGLTREEYTALVRRFKELPVWGFEGMTYGEGFFQPMLSLVRYLHENGYSVYICSGSDRDARHDGRDAGSVHSHRSCYRYGFSLQSLRAG